MVDDRGGQAEQDRRLREHPAGPGAVVGVAREAGTGVAWISAKPGPQSTASSTAAVLYLLAVVAICP